MPSLPASRSRTLVTRYPGRPIFKNTLRCTLDCFGATCSSPSFMSRAARRARFVWCFLPCVCARYEPSFVCSVRQRRHSSEPRWLRRMYGSYVAGERETYRRGWEGGEGARMTHLVQVYHTHGNFAQTLPSVDIGFRRSSNTTTAKLRTDSILPRKRYVNPNAKWRCSK